MCYITNVCSRSLIAELKESVDQLSFDTKVRAVIVRSLVPGIFCAGADLIERATLNPHELYKYSTSLRAAFLGIEQLPMPVLAAVDGHALGGGLELALSTDIIIVANDIQMGLVETSLAIIPGAGGTQRLPRRLNASMAKELIFTARRFTGASAQTMGLTNHGVEQVATKDGAYQKALEIAKEILPNGAIGVRMAKRAINRGVQVDITSGLAIEEAYYAQTIPTKDRLEGLRAFAEKRKPNYTGE